MKNLPLVTGNAAKLLSAALISLALTACGGGGSGGGDGGSFVVQNNSTASVATSSETTVEKPPVSSTGSSKSSIANASSSAKTGPNIDITPPSTPGAFFVLSALSDRIALSWSPATDNEGVVYYRIYRDQFLIDVLWAPEDSYIDFDVAPSKSYTYGISAGDASGNWSPTMTLTAQTTAASSKSSTSKSSSSISSTTTSVGSSTSTSTASSSKSSTSNSNSSGSSTSNSNSSGSSTSQTSSAGSSTSTSDTVKPSTPSNLTAANVYSNKVDLTWNAATDNVGVTAYRVYRGSTLLATLGKVLNYSDLTAAANQQYTYGVSAGDAAGNWSSQVSVIVNTPNAAVGGDVTLYWQTPTERENGAILNTSEIGGFELRYKLKNTNNYTVVTLAKSDTSKVITSLPLGDYDFEIAVYDNNMLYSEFITLSPQ